MNAYLLWAGAGLSALTFAVHFFIGGRYVARPLLADQSLPRASKWLNYYCWHMVSVLLLFMVGGYAYAARTGQGAELIVFMGICAAAFSPLSAYVALRGGIHPLRFPSTSLFAALTLDTAFVFVI